MSVHMCICRSVGRSVRPSDLSVDLFVCMSVSVSRSYTCISCTCQSVLHSVQSTIRAYTQDCSTVQWYINVHVCVCTVLHTKECTLNVYVQCTSPCCVQMYSVLLYVPKVYIVITCTNIRTVQCYNLYKNVSFLCMHNLYNIFKGF